jgi:uncharacterized membrane protein YgaE (UPF0421/DUF939 family)
MSGKLAGVIFVGICILLAILLLTRVTTGLISGILFAISLVVLGLFSQGFRKK